MFVAKIVAVVVSMLLYTTTVSAFRPSPRAFRPSPRVSKGIRTNEQGTEIMMSRFNDPKDVDKPFLEFMANVGEVVVGAALLLGVLNGQISPLQPAKAEIDYFGIIYLGGGDKIDINNANIRAYLKVRKLISLVELVTVTITIPV